MRAMVKFILLMKAVNVLNLAMCCQVSGYGFTAL